MQEAFDWNEEPPLDPAIEYQGLLRGLRRKRGFGLYFVQCSPSEGTRLIERIRQDLPQKIEVLKFDAAMDGNFYQCVADYLQAHSDTEVLFVQGLEYSLLSYEATKREEGWSSEEIYSYSWKAVPRLLGNLNLQRERFRDNFPIRFVFLLPLFAMKYLIRRAPDFFDWRSGIFEIPSDSELLEQESLRILQEGDYDEYLSWTQPVRDRKIAEIQCWISEPNQTSERKSQLFVEQGNLFAASSEHEAAVASYDQALKHKPDYDQTWYNRGVALSDLKRYEEALTSYDQALRHRPDKHEAWNNRGTTLNMLQRYEEAIASFDQALKLKSDEYKAWNNRGDALRNLKCYEEAISSYGKALEIKPDSHFAWGNRGDALCNLKRYEEAISSYDKALEIEGQNHGGWNMRGITLESLGRYEEAVFSYDKALEIKPDFHFAWGNRGDALHSLGRYGEAISSYDKATEFKLDYYRVWRDRGLTLSSLEQYEEAVSSYDQALKIKPDDARALYYKACCYGLQSQADLAIANLKQAIDFYPECREMAKTDADFDGVRDDDRFQALLKD
jgi:tetratricopeptide (TPR) repeat protein